MINILLQTETILTASLLVALVALSLMIIFAINSYRYKQKQAYSFLNQFPFELTQGAGQNNHLYIHILVLLFSLASVFFGFYRIQYPLADFSGLSFLLSWSATSFVIYLVFIVKFTSVKRHLLISSLLFILTILNGLMMGLYLQRSPELILQQAHPIISYALALIALLLAVNPKLSHWSFMDKIEQQDGTIIVLRPKVFILALTEWALIIINILIMLNSYFSIFAQ